MATHLGPRPERVTIDVNDFKSLGSNGSGNFGFATPYSVESRLEIKQLLLDLYNLRNRNSQGDHLSPDPSIRSQLSTASSVEESDSVSQAVFATQTPFAAPAARRLHSRVAGKQSGLGFAAGTDDRDTATYSNGALSKNDPSNNSLADSEQVRPGKPTVNGKKNISHASAALLGLVQQAAQPIAKVKPILQATNRNQNVVPDPRDKVTVTGGQGGMRKADPPPVAFTVTSPDIRSNEAATTLLKPAANYDSSQPAVTREQIQHPIRNQISNRDVRIPKDQALLLNSEDCEYSKHQISSNGGAMIPKLIVLLAWLPALPGHRAPTANIPITILDSLNREADLSALRATNPLKRKRGATATNETQGVRSGTSYESESELLISSGQWPSSPDRNQPPPDSSMGSANFPEVHDKARSVAPSTPGSLTRKIPNLSPSLSVIAIMPPGIGNGQTSTRNSKEPSPSIISNSAGEDKHMFKCHIVNCGRSYKSAVALNYHTERYHTSRESRERFKCTEENCNKSYTTSGGLNHHVKHHHDSKRSQLGTPKTSSQVLVNSFADKEISASLPVNSQSSESDLEMKIPDALHKDGNMDAASLPMQQFPSTATQPELPFTQVKRTPYPNGQTGSIKFSSPLQPQPHGRPTSSLPDSTSHVNLSVSEHPASPGAKTQTPAIDRESPIPKDPEMGDKTVNINGSNDVVESDTEKPDSHHEAQVSLEKTVPRVDTADQLPRRAGINGFNTSYPRAETEQLIDSVHGNDKAKRKPEDAIFLSPNVSKRRKRLEFPATFEPSEEVEDRQDPSAGARLIRKEFLASRKRSESSTPIQSPTKVLPDRFNETLRPAEISSAGRGATQIGPNVLGKAKTIDVNGQQTAIADRIFPADLEKSPSPGIDLDSIESAADGPHSASATAPLLDQAIQSVEHDVNLDSHANQQQGHLTGPDDGEARPGAQDQQDENTEFDQGSEPIVEDHPLQDTEVSVPDQEAQSAPAGIFDIFKATYPNYNGDIKHFVKMCMKISTLLRAGRMEYQFLWDDFIIRQKTDYASYVIGCTEDGEDPMAYEDFYSNVIMETKYRSLVLTRRNLEEALSLIPQGSEVAGTAHEIKGKDNTNRESRAYPQIGPLSPSASSVVAGGRRPASIIDLTGGDQGTEKDSSPTDKQTPSRRPFSWKESGSPLGSDASHTSPGSSQHARFKQFMNTSKISRSPGHKPTARNRHDRPVSRGAMIISDWGVSPNEIIKTKYFDSITQKQVNLMKDIAHDVDLAEGRRLIEKQIRSRTQLMPGNSTPKLTDEDLEAVKEAIAQKKPALAEVQTQRSRVGNDSSMTTSDPMSTSQANASEVLRDPSGSDQWWRDDSSPFNVFARAYASIKPGHGNAFAKNNIVNVASGHRDDGEGGRNKRRPRRIDILKWEL